MRKILWVHPDLLAGRNSRKETLNNFTKDIVQDDTDGKDFYVKKDLAEYDLVIIRGLFLRELTFEEILTLQKNIEEKKVKCVVDSINDSFLRRAIVHGFEVIPRGNEKEFYQSLFKEGSKIGQLKRISARYLESRFDLKEREHQRTVNELRTQGRKYIIYCSIGSAFLGFIASYFVFL